MKQSGIRLIFFAVTLVAYNCKKKPNVGDNTAKSPWRAVMGAFFSTPYDARLPANGLWSANREDFRAYVESRFLKGYKPEANENSAGQIRENLRDTHYFLRLNFPSCDELFFTQEGEFTVGVGQLSGELSKGGVTKYALRFTRLNRLGKQVTEKGLLHVNSAGTELVLQFGEGKLKLHREVRKPADLIKEYENLSSQNGLVKY